MTRGGSPLSGQPLDPTRETEPLRHLFDRLAATDPPAGEAYERLRVRLVRFFRFHAPAHAEALADRALDRLARKLEAVAVEDLSRYALGIARNLVREHVAEQQKAARAMRDPHWQTLNEPGEDDQARQALEACLRTMAGADRTLLLDYYRCDGGARIRSRRTLARRLGVSLNALRNRALRLRRRLEQCIRERLGTVRP